MAITDISIRTNVYSQHGEDGIIAHILQILGIEKGICCEFGAWDGRHLSNTFNLISNNGWGGILIEGDPRKFDELKKNMAGYASVTAVNAFVSFEGHSSLDAILTRNGVKEDFDLLSIDIDGCDYYIWESLVGYRPKIVVIEYNPTIPNFVDFVQKKKFGITHGASIKSLRDLGVKKGYQLAYVTGTNGIFVRDDLFHLLDIADNSLDSLRSPYEGAYIVYQMFDGTLKFHGNPFLRWHGIPIRDEDIQVLPRMMRFFPDNAPAYARLYYRYLREVRPAMERASLKFRSIACRICHAISSRMP